MFVRTRDFQQQRELRLWPLIEQLNPDNLLVLDPAYYRKTALLTLMRAIASQVIGRVTIRTT